MQKELFYCQCAENLLERQYFRVSAAKVCLVSYKRNYIHYKISGWHFQKQGVYELEKNGTSNYPNSNRVWNTELTQLLSLNVIKHHIQLRLVLHNWCTTKPKRIHLCRKTSQSRLYFSIGNIFTANVHTLPQSKLSRYWDFLSVDHTVDRICSTP